IDPDTAVPELNIRSRMMLRRITFGSDREFIGNLQILMVAAVERFRENMLDAGQ
ncbi:MAG: hypothetical protein GWO08_06230, partial [Gammaproteobacteria bacterium]|nr:hypothetical protein [Gammaproteobacteria bacterium]